MNKFSTAIIATAIATASIIYGSLAFADSVTARPLEIVNGSTGTSSSTPLVLCPYGEKTTRAQCVSGLFNGASPSIICSVPFIVPNTTFQLGLVEKDCNSNEIGTILNFTVDSAGKNLSYSASSTSDPFSSGDVSGTIPGTIFQGRFTARGNFGVSVEPTPPAPPPAKPTSETINVTFASNFTELSINPTVNFSNFVIPKPATYKYPSITSSGNVFGLNFEVDAGTTYPNTDEELTVEPSVGGASLGSVSITLSDNKLVATFANGTTYHFISAQNGKKYTCTLTDTSSSSSALTITSNCAEVVPPPPVYDAGTLTVDVAFTFHPISGIAPPSAPAVNLAVLNTTGPFKETPTVSNTASKDTISYSLEKDKAGHITLASSTGSSATGQIIIGIPESSTQAASILVGAAPFTVTGANGLSYNCQLVGSSEASSPRAVKLTADCTVNAQPTTVSYQYNFKGIFTFYTLKGPVINCDSQINKLGKNNAVTFNNISNSGFSMSVTNPASTSEFYATALDPTDACILAVSMQTNFTVGTGRRDPDHTDTEILSYKITKPANSFVLTINSDQNSFVLHPGDNAPQQYSDVYTTSGTEVSPTQPIDITLTRGQISTPSKEIGFDPK